MSGALLIGPAERAALASLRERATAAPVNVPALVEAMRTQEGSLRHRRQMAGQSLHLPTRYFVTYSVETGHPVGTCRHMSMSCIMNGRVPTTDALWMVAEELGFVGGLEQCNAWSEPLSDGGRALHVVQPVDLAAATRGAQ